MGKKRAEAKYAKMLNGGLPIFSQFGNNIYASDVVQQSVNCIAREAKKLTPMHIRRDDTGIVRVNGNIQNVLSQPNPLMTTTDLIEKIVWQLYSNFNSFIFPVWEGETLKALYPLSPVSVTFLQDATNRMYVDFEFANGVKSTIPYDDIIHLRYNFNVNEFMGGNEFGQPDNKSLLKSLELNDTLLQGVSKALKSSFSVNGVVKYNTLLDNDKIERAVQEMTDRLNRNESGFLTLDLKTDFIPLSKTVQMVDPATLKFVDEKILRHFGVPLPILTGDYTKAQYEAFFQKTMEPLIATLNQAFTKGLFSSKATNGYGNEIVFYHDKLNFMTMSETIQYISIAASVGSITINEIRSVMGFSPVADPEIGNTLIMSKNYGSVQSVKDMDLNSKGGNSDAE